ncbi:MAG: GNAT family N-acetyltransferase [Actinomycetes bacterium]|jgi:RimJ/RimL family protein N-acetyltransferase|nr:GNAT family protein [Actinomycetes bacterium]
MSTLTGGLVRLDPLSIAHAAGLAEAAAESREHYGYSPIPEGADRAEAFVRSALAERANGESIPYAIVDLRRDRIAGSTRFMDIGYWSGPPWIIEPAAAAIALGATPTVAEIGHTWLAAGAQRTGINVEMKLLMLALAFDDWQCLRITLKTDARNDRSRTAISALGAAFEGIRRAHMPASDGGLRDSAYYSIVAAEWPAVRDRLRARLDRFR